MASVAFTPERAAAIMQTPKHHKPSGVCPRTPTAVAPKVLALHASRPFWYDIDLAREDCQTPSDKQAPILEIPKFIPAFEGCDSSETSTGADLSPSQTDAISPLNFSTPLAAGINIAETSNETPASSDKQCRKVFVGGIPQTVDHNDLYKMFSKIAKVKKAWLQMFHENKENQVPTVPGKKHRGFGFVIFAEASSVDKLLGGELSKFILLGVTEDMRLEVKRAIGKTSAAAFESSRDVSSTSPEIVAATPLRAGLQGTPCPISIAPYVVSPLVCSVHTVDPVYTQWHCNCCGPMESLPSVPPFPLAEPSPQPQVLISGAPQSQGQNLSDFLLGGFVGRDNKELEVVLRQAMPDVYED